MKIKNKVGLTIGLILFCTSVFADVPGGCGSRNREKTYKISFSNIASLGNAVLHLKYDYDSVEEIITRDTTYFITQGWGARLPMPKAFFAVLDKKSTDTVEFDYSDTDNEFNFSAISNNKLQFSKKSKEDTDKSLVSMSFWAIVGLVFLYMYFKKKTPSKIDKTPSA